jgi:hypothetical protein
VYLPYKVLFSLFPPYQIAAKRWLPDQRTTTGLTLKRLVAVMLKNDAEKMALKNSAG